MRTWPRCRRAGRGRRRALTWPGFYAVAVGSGRIEHGQHVFVARLIDGGRVRQVIEFEATDPTVAWFEANDGIDPLSSRWVEVQPKPEPQGELQLS